MIHCAIEENAELVIVSRDTDYGVMLKQKAYINDHLKQEFQERVSKKRKILLYNRLTDALKHFNVAVSQKEVDAETDLFADFSIALKQRLLGEKASTEYMGSWLRFLADTSKVNEAAANMIFPRGTASDSEDTF